MMHRNKTTFGLLAVVLAAAMVQAAAPTISCKTDGNNLIVTYTGTLYQSSDAVNWTEVSSASSPYQVKMGNKKLFFCAKGESKNFTISLSDTVDLNMIWIEPGTFIMGSPEDELGRYDTEVQHEVTLTKGYWMGKYEVTQAQYEVIMGTNPSDGHDVGYGNPVYGIGDDYPVCFVSWDDAMDFCAKLTAIEKEAGRLPEGYGYTLPTEAQWEYACRAGTTTALNSGKNLSDIYKCSEMDEVGWYGYNSDGMSQRVGQKQPNAWGLYDMHGNVMEWCLDWYTWSYPTSAVVDPMGPETGVRHLIRGGSWDNPATQCRSAYRVMPLQDKGDLAGFRVALAPVPPSGDMTIPLSDDVNLDMIWIKPGTFMMGSPEDELGRDAEKEIQHQVTLTKAYWLGKYEVTQAQYEAIMGTNPSKFKGADLPVEMVSWSDAKEFCKKLTEIEKAADRLPEGYEYTLPTEAQWEYACRAGTTSAFNNGTNIPSADQKSSEPCPNLDEVGWYKYNSNKATHPAGQKQPNAWGLYDMHGNVSEWCLDVYWSTYPSTPVTDPTGADSGSYMVVRGGLWAGSASGCRSASRSSCMFYDCLNSVGFRVALTPVK